LTKKGLLSFERHFELGRTMVGNKLIAEFMGYKVIYNSKEHIKHIIADNWGIPLLDSRLEGRVYVYYKMLAFHKHWGSLIKAIEDIKKLPDTKQKELIFDALTTLDIDLTFKAVLAFVKEYNKLGK